MLPPLLLAAAARAAFPPPASTTAAEIFNEPHNVDSLRQAQKYADKYNGFLASLPQMLAARTGAPYDNEIWDNWYSANSEESVVKTSKGTVVVAVHGGGILGSPERFEKGYDESSCGPSGEWSEGTGPGSADGGRGLKLTEQEASDLVDGKLPDGTQFPVYAFDEFKKGVANLPQRYGITLDFDTAKKSTNGFTTFETLKDDPLMIIRAGGVAQAAAYLDRFQRRHNTTTMGAWHPFGRMGSSAIPSVHGPIVLAPGYAVIGAEQYNNSGYEADYGIGADANIHNRGRYIGVAPQDESASMRQLPKGAWGDSGLAAGVAMEAKAITGPHMTAALRQARWHVIGGDNWASYDQGFVASLPQIIRARLNASITNEIWTNRFSTYSDESLVTTPEGKKVVVTVHGGGVFSTPERIEKIMRMGSGFMTAGYGGELTEQEARDLLNGKLPDGATIPMYSYDDFKTKTNLPQRYGVILDYELAKKSPRGYEKLEPGLGALADDPSFIIHAGGIAQAAAYLSYVKNAGQKQVGNWPLDYASLVDADKNQCRVLFIDMVSFGGGEILASDGFGGQFGRYIAVAPKNASASLRHIAFA